MAVKDIASRLIRDSGITQVNIAARIGLSEKQLSNRLTGNTPFRADELPPLAAVLDKPCSIFFEDSDCPESRRPLLFDPSTREARWQAVGKAELAELAGSDFEATKRFVAMVDALLHPPDIPGGEERAS